MPVTASSSFGYVAPYFDRPDEADQQGAPEHDSATDNDGEASTRSPRGWLSNLGSPSGIAAQIQAQTCPRPQEYPPNTPELKPWDGKPSQPLTEPSYGQQAASEIRRVIGQKVDGLKDALGTVWDAATDWSGAGGKTARASIGTGITNTAESLGTLIGPSGEDMGAASIYTAMTGDTAPMEIVQAADRTRQQAYQGIGQQIKQSWNEAEARNGKVGASAMVLATLGTEIIGTKGAGALTHVAVDVAESATKLVVKDAVKVGAKEAGETAAEGAARIAAKEGPVVTSEGTANAATTSKLGDDLAARMSKPIVSDTKLGGLMDDLYRDGAKIGTGSTADAVRYEIKTGNPVGGVFHAQKADDYSAALQKWLDSNPNASFSDRSAAQNVLRDLQNALNGK